jgi:hypothetical protein
MAKAKNRIFDFIDAMTVKKTPVEGIDFTGYSSFIIDKLIGSTEMFLPIVRQVNTRRLTNKQHYQFYKSILPKRKIFSTSIKSDSDYLKKLQCICKYYECGTTDAELYMRKLSPQKINNIIAIIEGLK